MSRMPESIRHLSAKRRKQLYDLQIKERKDAALNAVVIGVKGLNHIHKLGLKSLKGICMDWGQAIREFYAAGGEEYAMFDETEAADAGSIVTDLDKVFPDLSERVRREIRQWLTRERKVAQWNARMIGEVRLHEIMGYGTIRMGRLQRQWDRDIREFYEDRETASKGLQAWIEDIGFIFENGKLITYYDQDGKVVRKATAEKILAEREDGN